MFKTIKRLIKAAIAGAVLTAVIRSIAHFEPLPI